jgi:hypothetical protein
MLFAALEGYEQGLEHNRNLVAPVFEMFCGYIARRQSEGAFRDYPPGLILAAIAGMAKHFGMMTGMFGFCAKDNDEQVADAFVRMLLDGIRPAQTQERSVQS